MRWLGAGSWVFLALFVTWIAIFLIRYQGAIFSWAGVRTAVPALAILLLISVTLFFAMRAVASRMPRIRLGAAANALHFVLPDPLWPRWHRGQVPWARTYFDGQRLLAGNHLVLLRAPLYGPVFDHAELQREVLPRIPPENVVSRARFTRLALPALKSQLIFIVLIALLAVVVHVLVRGRLL